MLPPVGRILNWPKEMTGHCHYCGDDGLFVYRLRKPGPTFVRSKGQTIQIDPPEGEYYGEMVPCPFCVKGFRIEFSVSVKRNSRNEVEDEWYVNPRGGAWGKAGYWQDRELPARTEPPPQGDTSIPEWVHVWWWARRYRTPPEQRLFPQEDREIASESGRPGWLSVAEYLELLMEWKAAGAPRTSQDAVVGAAPADLDAILS